jgi:hypothetical protein
MLIILFNVCKLILIIIIIITTTTTTTTFLTVLMCLYLKGRTLHLPASFLLASVVMLGGMPC